MTNARHAAIAEAIAVALSEREGLFAVVTPAAEDEFILRDGSMRTWQYIEEHLPYVPPIWWQYLHAAPVDCLTWLRDKRFVTEGEATALRVKLLDRSGRVRVRYNLPVDGDFADVAESLAAHLSRTVGRQRRARK